MAEAKGLYAQKPLHISPSRASYGVPFLRIWVKIDRVITAPHCIYRENGETERNGGEEKDGRGGGGGGSGVG